MGPCLNAVRVGLPMQMNWGDEPIRNERCMNLQNLESQTPSKY